MVAQKATALSRGGAWVPPYPSALARSSSLVARTSGKRSWRPSSVSYRGSLSTFSSLPFLRWRRIGSNQLLVGEALADNRAADALEPTRIVGLAVVVAEGLLIEIAEQVERLNADVGSLDGSLEQAPEILQTVGVDATVNVSFGVVDELMGLSVAQQLVGLVGVGVDVRAYLDVAPDDGCRTRRLGLGITFARMRL
jgi:hypothetical protein